MKIHSIELKDVGGIPYLKLENLNSKMNIICGENGVGKTNILDAIAASFSQFDKNHVRKRAGSDKAIITIKHDKKGSSDIHVDITDFEPNESDYFLLNNKNYEENKHLMLYIKTNRGIDYKKVKAIIADPDSTHRMRNNSSGVKNEDIKDWLLNRVLHSKHYDHLTETQLKNLESAKECFNLLNPEFKFKRLNTSNEIFVDTPTGEIFLEFLSSGFKSTLFILLGLIKEIDFRFDKNRIAAKDFEGIILIDEIELHLHPEWQGRIINILKELFPYAQFFIATHSPHVIQSAFAGEVIALERQNNEIVLREIPNPEYGYQGWTIEEILEDVMGMADLRTKLYKSVKDRFDEALQERNRDKAYEAYCELDKMLHPNYPLRPVFKLQLDSLGE
ncbi:AAA family ATPase [Acinetobacter seifertii]|uniref:AAA family ATPase n=1 Tax=Acinetobacter seifertii TaxID=1530123 RepID=UPI00168B38B8|nr:AAA family ATPase [Acinetobacter seifertii]QNX34742.1 AAA family ATPase [Acinetobacter seifertii]